MVVRTKIRLCCIALLGWGGLHLSARELPQDTIANKVHRLDEVVVSASVRTKSLVATTPVQLITGKQFEQQGVTDVADALRRFAGVNVKDYGGAGGLKTVSVRSLGAQHTAVAYDGIVVTDCQSGQVDLSRFSLDIVKSLSLTVADNDDIFLPARTVASAAAIRLQTQMPDFAAKNYRLKAELKTGSFGLLNPFARYDLRLNNAVSMSLSGDFMRADNLYPFTLVNGKYTTTERRNNNYIETYRTEYNLYARPNAHSVLNGKIYYYDSFRELPGPVILYNNICHQELAERNFFSQLHYRTAWKNRLALQLNGKFNWGSSHYHDEGEQYPNGEQNNLYLQREYYASGSLLYTPHARWALSYAADYSFNNLSTNAAQQVKPYRHTVLQTLTARYRTPRFTATALLLGSLYFNGATQGDAASHARRLSPSLSFSWKPCAEEELYLRASYKDIFRVATFTENYFDRWGSRDLQPEVARQYNVGATYGFSSSSSWLEEAHFSLDGYYNYVNNKIVAMPFNMFFWTMVNLGHVDILGADATAAATFRLSQRQQLLLSAAYTYQYAVDKTDPHSPYYNDQIPYTPLHTGSLSVSWQNPYVNFVFRSTGVTKRYASVQNIKSNELEGYIECGVSIYRSFKLKEIDAALRADLQNFTNKQYSVVKNYPMPGRSYKLTLTLTI